MFGGGELAIRVDRRGRGAVAPAHRQTSVSTAAAVFVSILVSASAVSVNTAVVSVSTAVIFVPAAVVPMFESAAAQSGRSKASGGAPAAARESRVDAGVGVAGIHRREALTGLALRVGTSTDRV